MKIKISPKFLPLLEFKYRYAMIKSGRTGGKSVIAAQLCIIASEKFKDRDIVVGRNAYSDLKDSLYAEIVSQIAEQDLKDFETRQSPLRIFNKRTGTNIYFEGIGGSDTSRTRSFKPEHPLILVIMEETQQLKSQESLEQANASFRRHLDVEHGMFLYLFNPEPTNSHWLNVYYKMKCQDKDWLCIHCSFKDIWKYLNALDRREIAKMYILDRPRWEWMYMGATTGGYGSVYPEFVRSKHLLSRLDGLKKFEGRNIVGCIIGVDSAVTHDKTAYVPIFILDNGQAIVSGRDIFYHDPLKWGDYGSVQLMPFVMKWFETINRIYGFEDRKTPVMFVVDSAATELIKILRYQMPQWAGVYPINKPSIVQMVDNVKGVLARNMLYIIDDGVHETIKGAVKRENILVEELENLKWKEKADGSTPTTYDPSIPNDICDAFTYGVNVWFKNPNNIYWLAVVNQNRKEFYDLDTEAIE